MEKEKATIFDYARMCRTYHTNCQHCPMWNEVCTFCIMDNTQVDKANEIILKWCKEHPVETRQDRFLKMFPNAKLSSDGLVSICAQGCDRSWNCKLNIYANNIENIDCTDCRKEYWLAEVDENE